MAIEKSLIENLDDIKYELIEGSQLYVIRNFDLVKESFEKAIEDLHINEVLEDEKSFKAYKKRRTSINKAKEKIQKVRLQLTEAVMGTFQAECKELEEMLDTASKTMGVNVKAWTDSHKEPTPPTPPIYTITVSSGSKAVIEKIRKSLEKSTDVAIVVNYELKEETK